jgi:hypothetical protein
MKISIKFEPHIGKLYIVTWGIHNTKAENPKKSSTVE